jgi:hypothetical protein
LHDVVSCWLYLKNTFSRPRNKKEDNIKKDLEKRRWDGVERIRLAYDREKMRAFVNTIMDLRDS